MFSLFQYDDDELVIGAADAGQLPRKFKKTIYDMLALTQKVVNIHVYILDRYLVVLFENIYCFSIYSFHE